MKRFINQSIWFPLFLGILIINSCKKDSDRRADGKMEIKVSVSGSQFEDAEKKAAAKAGMMMPTVSLIQRHSLPFNKDLVLRLELSPATPKEEVRMKALLGKAKRASVESDVESGVKYKLLVYDDNGTYVTERDYVRGQESGSESLLLNSGENYTFIAYSVNSQSENPGATFSDPGNRTLAGTSLSSLDGTADLMYFRKDMNVSSGGDNYLSIIFQHKFSQIVTILDATATGETFTEAEASFDSHFPNADVQLTDAAITRLGTASDLTVDFTGMNTDVISASNILNSSTTTASLSISKLTIGSTTRTDLPDIANLSITPGVSYNLKLTLEPRDGDLVYFNQFSTRLGGRVWMSHNLGADTSLDPDQSPSVRALIGNYYQFGRPTVVATSNTGNGAISGWNTSAAPDGSWNSGTESNPLKSSNDPCPSGFRIPTRQEFQDLIDNSNASNIGTWTSNSSANTIGAAKVLTSKADPSVKLTFPAAGYRNASQGTLYWRGGSGLYWTISVSGNNLTRFSTQQNNVGISTGNGNQPNNLSKTTGFPLRCISER